MLETVSNASCLIRTRMLNIGFPGAFSHCPEGMSAQDIQSIKKYVDAAMTSVEELRGAADPVRRVVVLENRYLVLGIVCYLRTLLPDRMEEFNGLTDGRRVIQGFVGLVWNLDACKHEELPRAFPEFQSFRKQLEDKILPNWGSSANSKWAERAQFGIPVPYAESVSFPLPCADAESFELNFSPDHQCEGPLKVGEAMIQTALSRIAKGKTDALSVCTNAGIDYARQPFMNTTNVDCRAIALKDRVRPAAERKKFDEDKLLEMAPENKFDPSQSPMGTGLTNRKPTQTRRRQEAKPAKVRTSKVEFKTNMPFKEFKNMLDEFTKFSREAGYICDISSCQCEQGRPYMVMEIKFETNMSDETLEAMLEAMWKSTSEYHCSANSIPRRWGITINGVRLDSILIRSVACGFVDVFRARGTDRRSDE